MDRTTTKSEFDKAMPFIADVIKLRGRVRILILLENFKGWKPREYEGKVEKIVVVGEDRWQMTAYAFFRRRKQLG